MFAADAVYGNSIDLELEVIAKKGVARKAWLLMLVNVLLPAFTPGMVRRGCSSFKRRYACTYTRGSVRRASGFVLTGSWEVGNSLHSFVLLRWQTRLPTRSSADRSRCAPYGGLLLACQGRAALILHIMSANDGRRCGRIP